MFAFCLVELTSGKSWGHSAANRTIAMVQYTDEVALLSSTLTETTLPDNKAASSNEIIALPRSLSGITATI
jgi:hypothetical protein